MLKTYKAIIIVMLMSMLLSLAVSAEGEVINVDGNWHEPAQVSIWGATETYWVLGNSTTWLEEWDNPQILPYTMQISDPGSIWVGVPLRGEDWQINADGKLEIRFNLTLLTTTPSTQTVYRNVANVNLPGSGIASGAWPVWWGMKDIFYTNLNTGKTSYKAPTEGKIDVYKAFYGGNASVDAEGNTLYAYGYLFDIIIPANWLDSETRTIYIPISCSNVNGNVISMSYCQVRSLDNLTNYEILASILAAVQDIQGITPEQMRQAVYEALQMYAEEEQTKIDDKAGEAQAGIDSIINKVKDTINIDAIETAYEPYINLITSTDTADFDLTTQPLYITLSGEEIQILPSIAFNVTEAVRSLDEQATASSNARGIGGGWTALKTLIGAIISVSAVWMCIIVTKQLIEQVASGNIEAKTPDDITGG